MFGIQTEECGLESKISSKSDKSHITTRLFASLSILIALFSVYQSRLAINYTKTVNRASVSFVKADINFDITGNTLKLDFNLFFKNSGNEYLVIDNKISSILDINTGKITSTGNSGKLLNTLHPDVQFSQKFSQLFTLPVNDITDYALKIFLKNNVNLFIATRIDFSNDSISDYETYYVKYTGGLKVEHVSFAEYKKNQPQLQPGFLLKDDIIKTCDESSSNNK
jgi:hypothetical protein